jgi:hypothetical protein
MTRTRALSRLHPHVIGDQSLTKMEYIFKVLQAMAAAVHEFPGPAQFCACKACRMECSFSLRKAASSLAAISGSVALSGSSTSCR